MRFAQRVLAISLAAALAACSSGGAVAPIPVGSFPTVITIAPANGATAAAYRIGSAGTWTTVPVTGTTQFTVPLGQTAFSVAFICGGVQIVVSATITDPATVPADCAAIFWPFTAIPPTGLSGTYDGTAVGATGAVVSATGDSGDVFATPGAGSYTNLFATAGQQTLVLGGTLTNGDIAGFKILRGVAVTGGNQTVNFPALTSADAAVNEPLTVTGGTGTDNLASVSYLPAGGGSDSLTVTRFGSTSYSGVPATDWMTGDQYAATAASFDLVGNNSYNVIREMMTTRSGPIALVKPAMAHVAVNPADLSLPLTYTGLSSNDLVRGMLEVFYLPDAAGGEVDFATPAWLAGRSTYGPPAFTGVTGFASITPANTRTVVYAIAGFSYQPPFPANFIGLTPPAGQSLEAYVSSYSTNGPALTVRSLRSRFALMQQH